MKKIFLFMIVLVFASTLFIAGCGDDDGGSTTDPTIYEMEDYNYFLSISNVLNDDRDSYVIIISSLNQNQIETAELEINGEEIVLEEQGYEGFNFWIAAFDEVDTGLNLLCDLKIDDKSYSLNLILPAYPIVNWPTEFDPTLGYDINWTLEANSQYQYFYGSGATYDWEGSEEYDEEIVELDVSARSYSIPENWLDSDLQDYDFSLDEYSIAVDGKVIAAAVSSSYAYYYQYSRSDIIKKHNQLKKVTERLIK